jgi:hypothetical protein
MQNETETDFLWVLMHRDYLVGVSVDMNIIIERAHCAVGLKIEVPNEGTVCIDCSEVANNYNPTVIRMKGQIYMAEKAAAEKVRQ